MVDAIAMIPFQRFFKDPQPKHVNLFFIIKIIRIQKGFHLLSSNSFMRQVKLLLNKKLERII